MLKPIHWQQRYARRTEQIRSSAIREILKLTQAPDVISFAGGLPAPESFPIEAIRDAADHVLTEIGAKALQYYPTEGYSQLREMICDLIAEQGVQLSLENVLITSGSQQALDLLGKVFINRGDHILVESPSYLGALQAFNAYGVEYISVPFDDEGMRADALAEALRSGPKFIYLIPNFQNPTGITMSLKRRKEIIELAERFGVPIIEDDPYGKLRYEGEHIPSLLALDSQYRNESKSYNGNVIYLSTFSKTLAPGLRMAWITAPAEVIRKFVIGKQGADLHSPTFNQFLTYEAAKDGALNKYIERTRQIYGERRLVMLEALEASFPEEVRWTRPEGGMFLWVTLPEGMNTREILDKAIERKVAFVPGGYFHPNGGGENTMRLNFSNASPENIRQGIARLGDVLKDAISQ
ncbi:MAG TPA: PLP-dependent aminotransferase family protein [Anaerolineales bacterium]|nr:PLP-dependent aminotransferase family protein [Anaerolineales bacterium]